MFVSRTQADRAIFEAIRLQLVSLSFLPDITIQADLAAYEAARAALVSTNSLIDLFGVSSQEAKGDMLVDRIVVDRLSGSAGSIGATGITMYDEVLVEDELDSYTKYTAQDRTSNLLYEIRLVTSKTSKERIMEEVLLRALGKLRSIKVYNENRTVIDGAWLTLVYQGDFRIPKIDYNERLFRYLVRDIWDEPVTAITYSIAPITTINMELYTIRDLAVGTDGETVEPGVAITYTADNSLTINWRFSGVDNTIEWTVPSNLTGEITVLNLVNNVAAVTEYVIQKGGVGTFDAASLPLTIEPGDVLRMTVVKTVPGTDALVVNLGQEL